MTQEHPITPPPEVLDKLANGPGFWTERIVRAFQAGADQELEACCADLRMVLGPDQADWLRSVRRPKPPSLKEKALETLLSMQIQLCVINGINTNADLMAKYDILRRALESLPD